MTNIDNIPTEILLQLVTCLSLQDIQQCLTTCQKWNNVFKYAFYSSVTIHNSKQFDKFIKAIKQSAARRQQTADDETHIGHIVKELYFCKDRHTCVLGLFEEKIIIPHSFAEQLSSLCPNLEALDLGSAEWSSFNFHSNLRNLRRLKRLPSIYKTEKLPFLLCLGEGLTSLTIEGTLLSELLSQHCLLNTVLSFVPNLEELILGKEDEELSPKGQDLTLRKPTLAIEHLECIHSLLSKLRVLKIQGCIDAKVSESNEQALLKQSRASIAALNIHTFVLNTSASSHEWLIYIAHKYPNLRELTISIMETSHLKNVRVNNSFESETYHNLEKSSFLYLLDKSKYLKTIILSCTLLDNWLNSSFLLQLQQSCYVKEMQPLKHKNNQMQSFSQLMVAVKYGKEFLTTLEIDQWRFGVKIDRILEQLKFFERLTVLELKSDSYHTEYDLHNILESCSKLEELSLQWGTLVTVSTDINRTKRKQMQHYKLRSLRLTFIAFRSEDFTYLAQKCPAINYLLLSKSKCICQLNEQQCVIDIAMPCHSFNFVGIDNVRLDCPSATLFYPALSNYLRLISIRTEKWQRWYQHIRYLNHSSIPKLEQLDPYEAATISSYFADMEKRRSNSSALNEHDSVYNVNRLKVNNLLKMDLLFGYVKLRCAKVESIQIDGNPNRSFR